MFIQVIQLYLIIQTLQVIFVLYTFSNFINKYMVILTSIFTTLEIRAIYFCYKGNGIYINTLMIDIYFPLCILTFIKKRKQKDALV